MSGREFEGKHHWREVDLFASSVEHSTAFGRQYATWIREYLDKVQWELPLDATYLALGAGRAHAELALAAELGIENSRISLVDEYFSDESLRRFVTENRGVQIIPSDMFRLLQYPQSQTFSIVSAFGVEGQLQNPERMRAFVTGVRRMLRPEGLVGVCPYIGEDLSNFWEEAGFAQIRGHDKLQSALLYSLRS